MLGSHVVFSQAPVFRQFYFNPYLQNPAYAGSAERIELGLVHRQQWVGVPEGPVLSGLTFQYPVKKVSLGMRILSDETVALQRNAAIFTFGYKVMINTDHTLRFGISMGGGYSKLNLGETDFSNDPTVLNAAANQSYLSGNFGIVYSWKGLQFGFAIPEIMGQLHVDREDEFSHLKRQVYTLSYRKKDPQKAISINPYLMYSTNLGSQYFLEAAAIAYYKQKVWLGLSYRYPAGPGLFLGFRIVEGIQLNYSFELPADSPDLDTRYSQEFQIQFNSALLKPKN